MEVEVKETLGNVTTQPASTFADSRSTILTNVDKLCDKLVSDTLPLQSRRNSSVFNRRKKSYKELDHKIRKKLIVLYYEDDDSQGVTVVHEYDKLFDGTIVISNAMNEEDVRKEILDALKKKESRLYNFCQLKTEDFNFVKCINKKARLFDGDNEFNGKGLKQLYSGSIYVRLNIQLPLCEVSVKCNSVQSCVISYYCRLMHIYLIKRITIP